MPQPKKVKVEKQGKRIKATIEKTPIDLLFEKKSPTNADIMQVLQALYERG